MQDMILSLMNGNGEKTTAEEIIDASIRFVVEMAIELVGDKECTYLQFSDNYAVRLSVEPMVVSEEEKQ